MASYRLWPNAENTDTPFANAKPKVESMTQAPLNMQLGLESGLLEVLWTL